MPRAVLTIAGRAIDIHLNDSRPAADLLAQLPLALRFLDFGGQEKEAELPRPLDLTGAPPGSAASSGDIGYYAPNNVLVLYYADVGYFTGIVRLGTMTPDDTAFLRDLPGAAEAIITSTGP